ncbi:MAG: methyltransferase [DPANN group archaeon]|nr:methyltransferase [DPANN group archaeon]
MYEPREDSFLLLKHIKKYAKSLVLDMGTGSGILAEEAAKYADKVLGVDINEKAIEYCKKKFNNINNLRFRNSDLFSNIKEKFNLIIFNPPYLSSEPKAPDTALDGGKQGYEVIEQFLKKAKNYLKEKGVILLLFSSLSKKNKIDSILKEENYKYQEIDKEHIHFEELYVYKIQ